MYTRFVVILSKAMASFFHPFISMGTRALLTAKAGLVPVQQPMMYVLNIP